MISPSPPSPRARRILLADCDMFFVQVAQLEDPGGVGTLDLLLVGGKPEHRGVVASASYGARRYGVRSAMPMSQALRLCPQATVVPVPREACARRSAQVQHVLQRFAPVVEAASIDEFYLDLSGTERIYGDEPLHATAERIQQAVREETGVAVSLGGGTQRTVAKMAVSFAKPAGVHIVPAGAEAEFMLRFELRELPSVGPVFADQLYRRGVRTVRDALQLDEATLALWLGDGRARWLYQRIRGIDPTPVGDAGEAKSVSHERTFPVDLNADDALDAELLSLVVDVASTLRSKGLRARTVTVRVRDADFRDRQVTRTLAEAIESDRAIHAVARELLTELRERRRTGVRLLSVATSRFASTDPTQTQLFGPIVETERDRALSRATDDLRARFGKAAIVRGRLLPEGDRDQHR